MLNSTKSRCLREQALKRPGRLDREIYVGLPDDMARREIFEILFRRTPIADDVDIDQLVQKTHRYSGAEASDNTLQYSITSAQEVMLWLGGRVVRTLDLRPMGGDALQPG